MKKYSFSWNKFVGFFIIITAILWSVLLSQFMILGAIEKIGEASGWFAHVPSGGSIIMQYLYTGTIGVVIGCALLSIEVKEVNP